MLKDMESPQLTLGLATVDADQVDRYVRAFVDDPSTLDGLPPRYRKAIENAVSLFHFQERKEHAPFGPVFQPLLGSIDDAAAQILVGRLGGDVPTSPDDQKAFFGPELAYGKKAGTPFPAIFTSIRQHFADLAQTDLHDLVDQMYEFRNTYIAHEKAELTEAEAARAALRTWIQTLLSLHAARQ